MVLKSILLETKPDTNLEITRNIKTKNQVWTNYHLK